MIRVTFAVATSIVLFILCIASAGCTAWFEWRLRLPPSSHTPSSSMSRSRFFGRWSAPDRPAGCESTGNTSSDCPSSLWRVSLIHSGISNSQIFIRCKYTERRIHGWFGHVPFDQKKSINGKTWFAPFVEALGSSHEMALLWNPYWIISILSPIRHCWHAPAYNI